MGSVPNGPVIVFRVSGDQVSAGINPALDEVRAKAKTTSEQIADDWKRGAAQIRASVAQGVLPEKDIASLRQQQVVSLGKQIDLLRTRAELSNKELANLKAMTLEYERQKSHLSGTGGITTGTANALGQVSTQTTLGIERMVDSLVNRYLGGTAGAFTRLVRDVSYYGGGAGGSGGTGTGTGFLGGLSSGFSAALEAIGPLNIAIGGFIAGLTAEGVILASVTTKMFAYAQQVQNTAAATGLSNQQVQQYSQLAKNLDIDAGSVTTAFARMNVQLGEIVTKGGKANSENTALSRVMRELGVSATDSSGQLRPVNDILAEMSDAFGQITNSSQRTALELEAFGTRGRVLAQVIEEARNSGESLAQILQSVSKVALPDAEIQQLAHEKAAWDKLKDSIEAAKTHLEGFIATHLKLVAIESAGAATGQSNYPLISGAVGIANYFVKPGAPSTQGVPTIAAAAGLLAQDQQRLNDILLQRAKIVQAGGATAAEIEEKRAELSKAQADNDGQAAFQLANQIAALEKAQSIEQARLEIWKRINEELIKGNLAHPTLPKPTADQIINQQLHPLIAPNVGTNSDFSGALGSLSGILPPQTAAIIDQINKEHDDLFTTQFQKDQEHYREELDALNFALNQKLISQQQYNDAAAQLAQNWAKTQQDLNKKYIQDSDKLFDDLISGNTKSFSKALEKDIEDIVTEPLRKQFENLVGGLLGTLNQAINGTGGTPGAAPVPGGPGTISTGGGFGTIFGGATSPFSVIFNALGIKPRPGAASSTAAGSGQLGVATSTMNVQAGSVVILSGTNVGGAGSLSGANNFFGNNNPFAGGGVFFGNNSPFANAGFGGLHIPGIGGSSSSSPLGSNLGPLLAGLVLGGTGALTGSIPSEALGAATVATAAVKVLAATGKLGPNGAAIAGRLGQGFGGAGLIVSGVSQGGVGGAFSDIAGGAQIGSLFGPVGTGVGAAVGGLIALGNALFGNGGWQHNVALAMQRQSVFLPPSENFSFASNGSISSTFGTGFSQSGSSLYQYGINAPFYANAIYGPLTNAQKLELQQQELGLNSNSPFLNGNTGNIFTGVQPRNYRGYPTSPLGYVGNGPLGYSPSSRPAVTVNLNLPGYVDGQSAQAALGPHVEWIARQVSASVHSSSSGFGSNVRKAAFLP